MLTHSWTIQWYCYQKTDPVCETYDFLYTWTKTTQAYGSRCSKDMSSTHIFWILSNLKPLTNKHVEIAIIKVNCGLWVANKLWYLWDISKHTRITFQKSFKIREVFITPPFYRSNIWKEGLPFKVQGYRTNTKTRGGWSLMEQWLKSCLSLLPMLQLLFPSRDAVLLLFSAAFLFSYTVFLLFSAVLRGGR